MRKNHPAAKMLGKAQDLYAESREIAEDGAERAKTFIEEKPILSTLLGLGVGFLIGRVLRRSD